MIRALLLTSCLVACGGGGGDTDDGPGVIGDGVRPVLDSAEYACHAIEGQGTFYYFRIEGRDEQGPDSIRVDGAKVLFKRNGQAVDWDGDGSPNPEDWLDLNCEAGTDPRRCEGSLLEGDISGPCSNTDMTFEGWLVDEDGNESDRTESFEQNGGIAPSG